MNSSLEHGMTGAAILGDWGTTRLRLWLSQDGTPSEYMEGPGIGKLRANPAETLRALLATWIGSGAPDRIVLSGMAGARNGLHEVNYAECPTDVDHWRWTSADLELDGIPLRIAAGVACRDRAGRAEIMRGEETQVFGALRMLPELGDGSRIIVLPGTHSKWVTVTNGSITGFRTFPTGEMFALLLGSSLFTTGPAKQDTDEAEGFAAGLDRAAAGETLLGSVFEVRSAQLRDGRSKCWAEGLLSGLLVGIEVAEMCNSTPLSGGIVLIGEVQLCHRYTQALAKRDINAKRLDGDACAYKGLELLGADH